MIFVCFFFVSFQLYIYFFIINTVNSLIHLLNNDDTDDDNQLYLVKHSAYYGDNEFLNCCRAKRACLYYYK